MLAGVNGLRSGENDGDGLGERSYCPWRCGAGLKTLKFRNSYVNSVFFLLIGSRF